MSYRLIDSNAIVDKYPEVNDMPCVYADLPNGLDSRFITQQWIPCMERLPNEEEYIQCNGLFIVSDGDRAYAEYFDIHDKKCFGEPVMYGFRVDRAVTKWMPLPKP